MSSLSVMGFYSGIESTWIREPLNPKPGSERAEARCSSCFLGYIDSRDLVSILWNHGKDWTLSYLPLIMNRMHYSDVCTVTRVFFIFFFGNESRECSQKAPFTQSYWQGRYLAVQFTPVRVYLSRIHIAQVRSYCRLPEDAMKRNIFCLSLLCG